MVRSATVSLQRTQSWRMSTIVRHLVINQKWMGQPGNMTNFHWASCYDVSCIVNLQCQSIIGIARPCLLKWHFAALIVWFVTGYEGRWVGCVRVTHGLHKFMYKQCWRYASAWVRCRPTLLPLSLPSTKTVAPLGILSGLWLSVTVDHVFGRNNPDFSAADC